MTSETIKSVFTFLVKLGLLDVILPFIIVFSILFAVFENTGIFGFVQKKTKKNINFIVALVISLLFVISLNLVNLMNKIIWIFALILVIALFLSIILGLFGFKISDLFKKKE